MELSHLNQFLVMAQTQNMREASEILYISQPNLSRNLKTLEKELGYTLFDRNKKRLVLNKNGQEAYQYVKNIFEELNKLQSIRIQPSDRIPLNFVGCGAVYYELLVPMLAKSLPWYDIKCFTCNNSGDKYRTAMENEDVIVFGTVDEEKVLGENFDCKFLMTDQLCLSVPNKYPLSKRKSIHVDELEEVLKDLPVILSSHPESTLSRNLMKKQNIKINPSYVVNHPLNSRQLSNSDGIIFDPLLLSFFPTSNCRKFVPLEGEGTRYNVYIYYRKTDQSYTNTAIEWMIDFFREMQK